MTRSLPIVTAALIAFSVLSPLLVARALAPEAPLLGACLDAPPREPAPVVEPEVAGVCSADTVPESSITLH